MSARKVVLVTGASSGIGRAVACLLAERGFVVFGTSRDPSRCDVPPGVEMLTLDVRVDRSAADCVNTVLEKAGRLDVLVNNAGYSLTGALEEASTEQARELFETNFFGAVRMVKATLPTMRKQKGGRIINISSGMAQARVPFLGFYAASKCALEGYSEALWHELRPLNVHVSVVEPGFFKTNIEDSLQTGHHRIADYDPWRERALSAFSGALRGSGEPGPVAARVLRIVESGNPALYHVAGKNMTGITLLRRLAPSSVFRALIRRFIGLGPAAPR